jgi:hypothetical protein
MIFFNCFGFYTKTNIFIKNHKLKGKKVMANHIKKPNVEQKKKT